jgi:5,5'-dehydrodivanillate O-demethylase
MPFAHWRLLGLSSAQSCRNGGIELESAATSSNGSSNGAAAPPLRIDQCGPETLSGRYIRQFWTPVAMLGDLLPGRAKDLQILGEHFTYYRGVSGDPYIVAQTCAHRNVQLSVGAVEGECIRCFYHGWKYDSTGQCIEQPAESNSFARKVQIASFPTRVSHGIVFAYFGGGEPPGFQRLASLERPGHFLASSYVRETNFLNAIENNADWVHVNFVHARSSFTGIGLNREIPTITAEETEYGIAGYATYSDGKATRFHMLMPLASYLKVVYTDVRDTGDHVAWRVPIDDTSHRSFIITRLEMEGKELEQFFDRQREQQRLQASLSPEREIVDAILRGELHVGEVSADRPDIVGIQDSALMRTQRPLGDRPQDQLGHSDIAVIKLRRLWMREIEALANGEATTNWDWSGETLTAALGV